VLTRPRDELIGIDDTNGVLKHASPTSSLRPLLKWAGGKRQLLTAIDAHRPPVFRRYIEPFFGSGAVFFDLAARGLLDGTTVRLGDANPDLLGCYCTLRDRTEDVIAALAGLAREYRVGGDACYYDVRDRRFNPARAQLARATVEGRGLTMAEIARVYTPDVAAMLIFLNRTGFNGLFRLNRSGAFNVPVGRYTNPTICDPDHLRAVATAFRRPGVSLDFAGFDATVGDAGAGDFVYCDPPYAPLSATASFANYTAGGFSAFDQARLQRTVLAACRRGAHVVLSNSSAPDIVTLYGSREARDAGLQVSFVPARRAINSRAEARGPVNEVIVTNVTSHARQLPELKGRLTPLKMTSRITARRRSA
jgi:DNA adenine methylase